MQCDTTIYRGAQGVTSTISCVRQNFRGDRGRSPYSAVTRSDDDADALTEDSHPIGHRLGDPLIPDHQAEPGGGVLKGEPNKGMITSFEALAERLFGHDAFIAQMSREKANDAGAPLRDPREVALSEAKAPHQLFDACLAPRRADKPGALACDIGLGRRREIDTARLKDD